MRIFHFSDFIIQQLIKEQGNFLKDEKEKDMYLTPAGVEL